MIAPRAVEQSPNQAVRKNAEGTLVRLSLNAQHRTHIIEQLIEMLGGESGGQEQGATTPIARSKRNSARGSAYDVTRTAG